MCVPIKQKSPFRFKNHWITFSIFPCVAIAEFITILTGVLAPASLEACLQPLNMPMNADRLDCIPQFSTASDASNHETLKLLALRYYTPDVVV